MITGIFLMAAGFLALMAISYFMSGYKDKDNYAISANILLLAIFIILAAILFKLMGD